jgi:sulfate adenylyltransferase
MSDLGAPHHLLLTGDAAEALRHDSLGFASLTLSRQQLCDLELLLNGGFAPLTGFMDQATYHSVLDQARLPDGTVWPIPVTLGVTAAFAQGIEPGARIALRDPEGFMPAVLTVSEIWRPEREQEAVQVYGTQSRHHLGVRCLLEQAQPVCLGGRVEGLQFPPHYDFEGLWNAPQALRALFRKLDWQRVVAFQSSNLMHRMHRDLVMEVAENYQARILLHPAVGVTELEDLHYYARVHCYQAVQRYFPHEMATLSLLPLAMRMAGPREALWHAMINRNYGCTHFIVGPDHASPPITAGQSERFYAQYAAQEYVQQFAHEIGITPIPVVERRYAPLRGCYLPIPEIQATGLASMTLNDAEIKARLAHSQEIPDWLTYPEVLDVLRRVCPPRSRQGITLFFTGLSGSGKSTLANILFAKLTENGSRPVSLLDGDIVRQNLSSELGFSKQHRDINIRRIGFVASEITKNGGVAICAPIAPYTETRRAVRALIEQHGAFIEIYVSTPLETCELRDRKGLYAKARQGLIPEFTGISDPYEPPERPELCIDTSQLPPAAAAQEIMRYLCKEGYVS